MSSLYVPESMTVVAATAGSVTTNGGVTLTNISMKNARTVYIVLFFLQAASEVLTILTPKLGAVVATVTTAITFSATWWKNANIATNDVLAAQTAATTMGVTTGANNQIIVVKIDPAQALAQGSTLDCLGGTIATSGQATNFVTGLYLVENKFAQALPPTVLTD